MNNLPQSLYDRETLLFVIVECCRFFFRSCYSARYFLWRINVYIKWIKAYLENRKQRVRINSCFSNWANVVSGIPQGSILGPLLYIIYINELPNICDSKLFLYSDEYDTKVYRRIFNSQDKKISNMILSS